MQYADLLIWQYRHKPKALKTMQLLERLFSQGFNELYTLQNVLNIEEAIGHQLDLVGKHIGQSRVINGYQLRKFFGFRGSPHAMPFAKNGIGGGEWYRKRDPLGDSVRLDDSDYRFLLKCQILKNYQNGTLSNIIQACRFVFGQECNATDNGNMTVTIDIPSQKLNSFKRFAVENFDILPRQSGIKLIFNIRA